MDDFQSRITERLGLEGIQQLCLPCSPLAALGLCGLVPVCCLGHGGEYLATEEHQLAHRHDPKSQKLVGNK